jgi:tetratricopeptide (TPR) repeat protein
MCTVGALMVTVVALALDPTAVEDELRRARNEYAYGNYDAAAERLTELLYPMSLSTDEQVIEARKYLALSYYLLDRLDEVGEEFAKLLYLDPDHQLDPFSVAPSVIDIFESIRAKLKPELDIIRQRRSDAKLSAPHDEGVRRIIETRIIERSELATFMPFGVGQFQNGDARWGAIFAGVELLLLSANIGAYLGGLQRRTYDPTRRWEVQALAVTQYASLALFGVAWSVGVFHARLHFVPAVIEPPRVRD